MKNQDFSDLVESIEQAGKIKRGELKLEENNGPVYLREIEKSVA